MKYLIYSSMPRVAALIHSAIEPMSTLLVNWSSTLKAQVRIARYTTCVATRIISSSFLRPTTDMGKTWSQEPASFLVTTLIRAWAILYSDLSNSCLGRLHEECPRTFGKNRTHLRRQEQLSLLQTSRPNSKAG